VQTQLQSGYGVTFTPSAACTAYLGAYAHGSTAPTAAQLEVGTGAINMVSASVSAAASELSIGSLDFPIYDLYLCLHNGNGDSAVFELAAQFKAPPSGKVYRTLASISSRRKIQRRPSLWPGITPRLANSSTVDAGI